MRLLHTRLLRDLGIGGKMSTKRREFSPSIVRNTETWQMVRYPSAWTVLLAFRIGMTARHHFWAKMKNLRMILFRI